MRTVWESWRMSCVWRRDIYPAMPQPRTKPAWRKGVSARLVSWLSSHGRVTLFSFCTPSDSAERTPNDTSASFHSDCGIAADVSSTAVWLGRIIPVVGTDVVGTGVNENTSEPNSRTLSLKGMHSLCRIEKISFAW